MVENKELISVIVPIFNVEKYLKKTIESIISQIYIYIEIILVDDGSNDTSSEICEFYAKKDKRIKVFYQENKGVSSARNLGISNANGKYIVFIDGDDYVTPEYISSLYNDIEENNVDLAVQMYINYFNKKKKIRSVKEDINKKMSGIEFIDYEILDGRDCSSYVKIYKKSIIDKFEIKFNECISNLEDMLFLFEYCLQCKDIMYTSKTNYYRIIRNDGVVFSGFNEKKLTALKVFDIINNELQKYDNKIYVMKNMLNKFNAVMYFCGEIIYERKRNNIYNNLLIIAKNIYSKYNSDISNKNRMKYLLLIYVPNIYRGFRFVKEKIIKRMI